MPVISPGSFGSIVAPGPHIWIRLLGGTGNDFAESVAQDSSGNFVTGGQTSSQGQGSSDLCFARYDSDGNVLVQRAIGDTGGDSNGGVSTDGTNVIITGNVFTNAPNFNEAFVAKFNSSGTLQWQRLLGTASTSPSRFSGSSVADSSSNVYAAGIDQTTSVGGLLAKYNSSGTLQFQRKLIGVTTSFGNIAIDNAGSNVVVVGHDSGPGTQACFIAKYNSSGVLQWQRTLSGASNEEFRGVAIDGSDNIYCVGETTSEGSGLDDCIIAKYNSAGTLQWQRLLGDTNSNGGRSIAVDASGNVYVGCAQTSTVGIVLAKYDTNGVIQWQNAFGSSVESLGNIGALIHDGVGNIVFSGGSSAGEGEGSSDLLTACVPDDGSLTGTYGSITYTTASLTDQAATLTDAAGTAVDGAGTLTDAAGTMTVTNTTLVANTVP